MHAGRRALTVLLVLAPLLLPDCAPVGHPEPAAHVGSAPPTTVAVAHGCGSPYRLRSPHGTVGIDGCTGTLPATTPADLTVRRGQTFEVLSSTGQDGRPRFPAPASGDGDVVTRTAVSGRGGDGTYRAVAPGVATLYAPATSCPVLRVRVTG